MSFWCLQFSQKTNLKTQIFALAHWGRNFSFVFLGDLKKLKCPLEINGPLTAAAIYCLVESIKLTLESFYCKKFLLFSGGVLTADFQQPSGDNCQNKVVEELGTI